jgi:hypothetical protein
MSTRKTPKKETKSAPKKRSKPPPVIGSPVIGETSSASSFGVRGTHTGEITGLQGTGVEGFGPVGVLGASGKGNGGIGEVREGNTVAVLGRHKGPEGTGVRGEGTTGLFGQGKFTGVQGNAEGTGIKGEGKIGVVGQGKLVGVSGICSDSAAGASGPGVRGVGHYGGQFQGTSGAQLHLRPGTSVGRPTTDQHSKGEIFLDREATLFVCVADGTPGTWRRVMTEPA